MLPFFEALTRCATERGWLSLWMLRLDGRAVAMEYQIQFGGVVHALRADFDSEFAALSPGSQLNHLIARALFERGGVHEYDMGPGDNEYRLRWSTGTHPRVRLRLYGRRLCAPFPANPGGPRAPRAPRAAPGEARDAISGAMLRTGACARRGMRLVVASSAARVPGAAGRPTALAAPGIAVFTTGGGRAVELPDGTVVCGDLDLVNLEELAAGGADRDPVRVVAGLYAREGLAGIRRLRGGFAVAIWDARERRLQLAVDHHGIKRLFYARGRHGLAFASRAVALLAVPGVDGAVN